MSFVQGWGVFLLRRLGYLIVSLLVVSAITFGATRLLGNPAYLLVGTTFTKEQLEKVEKQLGLRNKQEIEAFGIAKFVELCKERVFTFAKRIISQSIRLGQWADWGNDYYTLSDENNYTIWSFLKKCHGRGLVYRGYDAMPWCPRCSVGLSQMEMNEGYQLVAHRSVFVKFPLRLSPLSPLRTYSSYLSRNFGLMALKLRRPPTSSSCSSTSGRRTTPSR